MIPPSREVRLRNGNHRENVVSNSQTLFRVSEPPAAKAHNDRIRALGDGRRHSYRGLLTNDCRRITGKPEVNFSIADKAEAERPRHRTAVYLASEPTCGLCRP